jgi:hypothetical protein
LLQNCSAIFSATSTVDGQIGQGLKFDGGYVNAVDIAGVDNIGQITISAWVKPSNVQEGGNVFIFSKNVSGTLASWGVYRTSQERFLIKVVNSTDTEVTVQSNIYQDTKWHHVVGTYDGSNVILYVDTLASAPSALTGVVKDTNYYVCMSATGATCGTTGMSGIYDDVRIYSRALSAMDILTIYNNGISSSIFWGFGNEETPPAPPASGGGGFFHDLFDDIF